LPQVAPTENSRPAFAPIVAACLHKEWLTLRGNGAQVIAMLTPLFFVVILNRTMFAGQSTYFLPGAIAYVLFGVLAGLYNVFGADGLGVQVYLLAPVRLRDVIVAKNLMSLTMIVAEAGLAWLLVSLLTRAPIPLAMQVSTGLWTIFVIAANLALGTMRSIQAPRRFIPGQMRGRQTTPTNRTSGLLILLVLFGSMALQFPVTLLSRYFGDPWLGAWIFGPLAAAAVMAYALLLRNAEQLIMAHRDVFAEELCKV
jgi:ABC-2 type transport system permease protein